MKTVLATIGLIGVMAAGLAAAAWATPPGGPHTPVTVCHKPGTPAEQTLVVDDDAVPGHLGHGDNLGPCQTDTTPTDTTATETTPTQTTPTETVPTVPTPTTPEHKCVFVGADKDGGHDATGGTNDDCAPRPVPPTAVTVPASSPPAPAAVTTTTTPAVTPPPAVVVVKPKPPVRQPAAKPKPAPKAKTPAKKPAAKHGHVCDTLADGTQRAWYKGGNGMPAGCYPIIKGSG